MARPDGVVVAALAALLCAGAVRPEEPPVFGSGVDLVLLDLVVRDS